MDGLSVHSRFVKHGPCPKCGSRDNVAWYSNGTGYCFGCRAFLLDNEGRREAVLRHVSTLARNEEIGNGHGVGTGLHNNEVSVRPVPHDVTTLYPQNIVAWLKMYDLTPADASKHNVVWSQYREQLVFQFFGSSRSDLLLWQARNFRKGVEHKHRFYTEGASNEVVAAYYPSKEERAGTAVVVEDCISAIKMAKSGYVGVPVLGSGMSDTKLRRLTQQYSDLVFWLDEDKFTQATDMARKGRLLGAKTCVVYTEDDPKCFEVKVIQDTINGKVQYNSR